MDMTATDIYQDNDLNQNRASYETINRYLNNNGY